ncbi:hypothetical protein QP185_01380 [Sphingomonas aerolata]|uniref:hypothetical protein n=1 Tax=Sphingomonas aerolata TaxID=185951 RepID=UPI002FE219EB
MQTRYVAAAVIAVMAAPAAAQSERSVVPLAQGWEFQRGGDVDPAQAAQAAQAAGSWERVNVPAHLEPCRLLHARPPDPFEPCRGRSTNIRASAGTA